MSKAVSNREICFIKAVLLLYEHGHFALHGVFAPPPSPNTIMGDKKCVFIQLSSIVMHKIFIHNIAKG